MIVFRGELSEENKKFFLRSNRIMTAALKKSAIYNVIIGSISSLEISVYQALLFA